MKKVLFYFFFALYSMPMGWVLFIMSLFGKNRFLKTYFTPLRDMSKQDITHDDLILNHFVKDGELYKRDEGRFTIIYDDGFKIRKHSKVVTNAVEIPLKISSFDELDILLMLC